jgi:hypothetical protein
MPSKSAVPYSDSKDVVFASSLDNARKCSLVLKCVYFPSLVVFTLLAAALSALRNNGYVSNFSYISYTSVITQAINIAIPTFLVPHALSRTPKVAPAWHCQRSICSHVFADAGLAGPCIA